VKKIIVQLKANITYDVSFKKLALDYIDMMIIHSPRPWAQFSGN